MGKLIKPNGNVAGINMMNAIKNVTIKLHPWGFFKDESNYDLIQNDLVDPTDLNLVRKKYGQNFNSLDAEMINEFTIINSEIAFALNLGFKIKFSKDMLDVFTGASFDDAVEFINATKKVPGKVNIQDIMNYICSNTNITELIKWIVTNGNPLVDKEKFGVTRYFIYSTDVCTGHNVAIAGTNGKESKSYFCPIFSVSVDGGYINISCTDYDLKTGKAISSGSRILARVLDDGTVQITSNIWHRTNELDNDIEKLIFLMHSDCYIILFLLSTIQELLIRETIKGIPQKEYKYTIDHIPSSILRDGKIHYTKYEEHLTTNPFYPNDRKSPRLHVVSGYYKKNGTWVDSYVRGTDEEIMSYVNDVLEKDKGDAGMSKTISNKELDILAPIIADELRKTKGKDKCKIIANKYKVEQSLVRAIAKTRKTGLEKFVPNNMIIDTINNDSDATLAADESININNVSFEKEDLEIEKENTIVCRDSRGRITDDCKLAVAECYEKGMTKEEISIKFEISTSCVASIIKDICGVTVKRKSRVDLTPEDKLEIVRMHENGSTVKEIMEHFNIAQITVIRAIKNGGGDIEMKRRTAPSSAKKSSNLNNHQYKKMLDEKNKNDNVVNDVTEKKVEKSKPVEEKQLNDVLVSNDTIVYAGQTFSDPKISSLTNTVTIGMVSDRHDIGNIGYLFEGPLDNDQIQNLKWQESVVHKFITEHFEFDKDGNATKYLTLYCTGIQVILASIIKVCYERHVNLVLKHYISSESDYISQTLINSFGNQTEIFHPFKKLEKSGKIYLYNTDINDIFSCSQMYSISLNVHEEDSIRFKSGECAYILCKSEEDAWSLYPKFVKIIQNNTGNEKNSVLFTVININTESFTWGDNISKSYNFK